MSNVIPLEPYRQRRRRARIAAACRQAVATTGILVIQDRSGRVMHLAGTFRFFDDCLEMSRDGLATRIAYDEISRVRVPSAEHYAETPYDGGEV